MIVMLNKYELGEVKVFKDPVHEYIHVSDKIIWDLIATREFQRLRRINQLGTTYLTFHGAEHSRFNHSLGVYEIVRRMIENFKGNANWKEEERLVSLSAALLHDLGHGPFSHSFEKVFDLDHEEYTQKIILGDTEVNEVLKQVSDDFPEKVASVINHTYENKLVVSLISSQIDADRMDYLLRDSYYTGVSYGKFDLERVLRVMRPEKNEVVIKLTGMHAVEDYIMSRYQMYWQVYFHPVTRSAEVILTMIFKRVKDLFERGYTFSFEPTHFKCLFSGDVSVEQYLALDEAIVQFYFQQWQKEKDPILRDLCDRFINRKLFKYIHYVPTKQEEDYLRLCKLFTKLNINPDYYLMIDKSSDLPYDVYEKANGNKNVSIQLQMPDGSLKELSEQSTIVDAISGKTRVDYKLYFPLDLLKAHEDQQTVKEVIDILTQYGSIS